MPSMARLNSMSPPMREISKRMEALCADSSPDFSPVRELSKVGPIGEMVLPVIPQSSYRERNSRLKHLEEDKNALIDELISKLESSEQQLRQYHIDQNRITRQALEDVQIRETLEQEVGAMRSILERNSYVTVLINGDALTFAKEYLNKGVQGGQEVAQSISDSIQQFATEILSNTTQIKIHVKLFANIRALSDKLTRANHVDKACTFEQFLTGLLGSNTMVDVIDTSLVQGLTTRKLQEAYRHDFVNVHCHQIFLAATANPEWTCLLDESPDIPVHERVTLLNVQGLSFDEEFQHEISTLKLNVDLVKIPTPISKPPPPTKIATPVLARIPSAASSKTTNSGPGVSSATNTPQLTWAAMTAQPFVPKAPEVRTGSLTPVSMNTPPLAKATTVSIPRNKHGQRIDPVDSSIPYQELQRIKKMKLCNIYYLIGKTECNGNCNHSHTYPLSRSEKDILKEVARMTACHNRTECDDVGCIYGHRCPQNKPDKKDCYYKAECRFHGWGHGIDDKVVKTKNMK